MSMKDWDSNPDNNNAAPPNGAPEGATLISDLNNIDRQVMADTREWYENPDLRDLGLAFEASGPADGIVLTGDQSEFVEAGQAVTWVDGGGAKSGYIVSVSVATNTTVTVDGTVTHTVSQMSVGHKAGGVSNLVARTDKANTFTEDQTIENASPAVILKDDTSPAQAQIGAQDSLGNTRATYQYIEDAGTPGDSFARIIVEEADGTDGAHILIYEDGRAVLANLKNGASIDISAAGVVDLNAVTATYNGDEIATDVDLASKKNNSDIIQHVWTISGVSDFTEPWDTGFGADDFIWGFGSSSIDIASGGRRYMGRTAGDNRIITAYGDSDWNFTTYTRIPALPGSPGVINIAQVDPEISLSGETVRLWAIKL